MHGAPYPTPQPGLCSTLDCQQDIGSPQRAARAAQDHTASQQPKSEFWNSSSRPPTGQGHPLCVPMDTGHGRGCMRATRGRGHDPEGNVILSMTTQHL